MPLHRLVFMGSPDFAVPLLEALASQSKVLSRQFTLAGVVTQPDRPAGRGRILVPPPIKSTALTLGIPFIQPEKLRSPEAMAQLRLWDPDLIIVAAFGQILRQEALDLPKLGCINVHASLLPRWRGAAPIQAAILAGDAETGITIMQMDSGVDTGPWFSQRAIPISPDDTAGSLFEKLSRLGAEFLLDMLPAVLSGAIKPHPQDASKATFAPMLKKEDGRLDFTLPAVELARRMRAMDPWPGAFMLWHDAPLKVLKAHVLSGNARIGERVIIQGLPAVGTKKDLLVLEEVQPAGKKPMPGKAFLAGAHGWGLP